MIDQLTIRVNNLEETNAFAAQLAQILQSGDLLILNGGLGAGKTHIVKAVAAALQSQDDVSSPTYTIANFYRTNKGNLLHMDAYRLESAAEFWDLGLEEQFETDIIMMEWGAKYATDFEDYFSINITIDKEDTEAREIQLVPTGERWQTAMSFLVSSLANLTI